MSTAAGIDDRRRAAPAAGDPPRCGDPDECTYPTEWTIAPTEKERPFDVHHEDEAHAENIR